MPVGRAETEPAEKARRVVDLGVVGEHVVIGVARRDDRLVHVDRAVAARLVVAKSVRLPGNLEEAGIEDRLLRRALAVGQRRQREEGLDRRAGRVGAAQRPVDERLVRRFVQFLPAGGIDAVDEQVRVEARAGNEREHVAGRGLDCDQRSAALAERLLGDFLQLDVERQPEVVAGAGRRARQRAHGAPAGVDFDLLEAGLAVQVALVGRLQPQLADVVGALVVGGAVPLLDAAEILVVDAADVPQHVRCDRAERILAEQPRLDLDAREPVAVHGKARDLLVGQARAQRQALEVLGFLEQLAEALAVARLHVDDLGQRVDRRVEILDARRLDLERVRRVALRQHDAVAVGDDAPIRHDRHDRDAIGLGEGLEVAVLHDLQVEEAREQRGERRQHEHSGNTQAAPEEEQLALGIAQLVRAESAAGIAAASLATEEESSRHRLGRIASLQSSDERRGRCGHCSTTEITGHSSAPTNGGAA